MFCFGGSCIKEDFELKLPEQAHVPWLAWFNDATMGKLPSFKVRSEPVLGSSRDSSILGYIWNKELVA